MKTTDKILVLGATGLAGSAIVRHLQSLGHENLLTPTRSQLSLQVQNEVLEYFWSHQPDYVFLAAATVGGILANSTRPADFIYQNLTIQNNVLGIARATISVKKVLFLGSSCIYPKFCPQPMREEHLLTGPLEETNKPYAVAKIAGLVMCDAFNRQDGSNKFISVMPTNLYGPNDNFSLADGHMLPALIHRFHKAKEEGHQSIALWGSGQPRRELLHVDDLASACTLLMGTNESGPINIGTGTDHSIHEIAEMVQEVVGHKGQILHDLTKPDGTPRKLLDVSKIRNLGWSPKMDLRAGIKSTYEWFLANIDKVRI